MDNVTPRRELLVALVRRERIMNHADVRLEPFFEDGTFEACHDVGSLQSTFAGETGCYFVHLPGR